MIQGISFLQWKKNLICWHLGNTIQRLLDLKEGNYALWVRKYIAAIRAITQMESKIIKRLFNFHLGSSTTDLAVIRFWGRTVGPEAEFSLALFASFFLMMLSFDTLPLSPFFNRKIIIPYALTVAYFTIGYLRIQLLFFQDIYLPT